MRRGAYGAWGVREDDFPRSGSLGEQLRFLLRYAILAPSAHNTQPWAFQIRENHIRVLLDDARALTVSDPTRREMVISVGAAVANLLVAAAHFGFRATIEEFPAGDDRVAAAVALVADASARTPEGDRLFAAIPHRRANRALSEERKVPTDVLMKLRAQAGADPTLDLVEDRRKIEELARLTGEATAESMGSRAFRAELSHWVRSNYTRQPDGMPGFSVGVPDLPSLLGPVMVTLPLMATAEAKKRKAQVLSSPLLGIISAKGDEKRGWLRAGLLLERVWLLATAEGLRMAVLAAVVEVSSRAAAVQRLLGTPFRPQVFFRVGYGPADPHPTPRRSLEDVVA